MTAAPDFAALRRDFPTLEKWTYLDVARKTIMPRYAEEALQAFCRDVFDEAGADAWSAANVEKTRTALAELLGCKPVELAFMKNTTEGLNIAAHAFDLAPGDNIVLTDMEHVNNVWVWRHWEAKGVEIRFVANRDGRLPVESFLEKIDERTRVVGCAWVTYGNGYRVDLPTLGRHCRERGIRLVVDGVQGAGLLSTPLRDLGADMIAIGGHKALLGLTGSGIIYCREELIRETRTDFVRPVNVMGAAANRQFDYVHDAHRFEAGNPNFLGLWLLRRSAAYLQSIGLANIERRIRELTAHCLKLVEKKGLRTQTPAKFEERCHIVNFLLPDAAAVQKRLREQGIVVNVKDGAIRASMSFFNNEDDLEKLVRAIPGR